MCESVRGIYYNLNKESSIATFFSLNDLDSPQI